MTSTPSTTKNCGLAADGRGLMPHHERELIQGSGLSKETIRAAGIYSEWTAVKLARLLRLSEPTAKKMVPAIIFPFIRADGTNSFVRAKPDRPRVDRDGKSIKYESPVGERNEIYLPPGVAQHLADPNQELLLTEGEKKSLSATQVGFPCIGLVGVFGWKEAKKEILLPDLRDIAWQGRRVFIAFDSDLANNGSVQDAEARLAAALQVQGAMPSCLRIPTGPNGEKQGLDDFVVAAGTDCKRQLRQLINEAVAPPAPDPASRMELATIIDPANEALRFLKAGEVDGVYRIRFHRGRFLVWINGRYIEFPVCDLRARLINHLNIDFYRLTTGITANVVDQVKAQAILPFSYEPPCWINRPDGCELWEPPDLLATKNAIIHIPTLAKAMHTPYGSAAFSIGATPRYFTPCALPFDFERHAGRPEQWLRFLEQIWGDDNESIEALQEWMGLCLVPDTSFQKILLVLGPKRSGKGTIARVLRSIVGEENCCGPTMGSFVMNFGLQPLLNKSVAIISDARLSGRADSAIITERLLSISGEDALTVDVKHQEPVTCKLLTRIVILTNELPRLGDSSGALAGRLIILRMTRSFYGKEDHELTNKLLLERAGILCWAIEGLHRLRSRGFFIQPQSGDQLREQMEDITSPISKFVRERCEMGEGFIVPTQTIYQSYVDWMVASGAEPPGDSQFGRDLLAAFSQITSTRKREGQVRIPSYRGIRLLTP